MVEISPNKEKLPEPEKPLKEVGVEGEIEKAPGPEIKETEGAIIGKEKTEGEPVAPSAWRIPILQKKPTAPKPILSKSETFKQIESILSEGLEQTYQSLPENLKEQFRQKGEEVTSQIEIIISKAKMAVHKIVELIKSWLLMIPGVNKFFLEQETKIKTDKIMILAEKKKKT